jgi:hypothetical protein
MNAGHVFLFSKTLPYARRGGWSREIRVFVRGGKFPNLPIIAGKESASWETCRHDSRIEVLLLKIGTGGKISHKAAKTQRIAQVILASLPLCARSSDCGFAAVSEPK